jgi:hypothetical protein
VFVEITVCAVSLIFSVFLFTLSRQFPPSPHPLMPGPAFFPFLVAAAVFSLSLAQLVITLVKRKKTGSGEEAAQPERKHTLRIVIIILLILLYALLWMYHIGHFLINSIAVFIPVSMLYGGAKERQWWKTSLFVVVLVVLTYVLFKYLLKVDL